MRVLRVVSTFAVAVLLAAMAASPAAASASAFAEPGAVLNLSWSAPAASNQVFTTTLTCHPTGGGEEWYMDAEAACGDLTTAGGNFESLPGRLLNCEGVQGWAIRTTASGHWFGQAVSYDESHANWCEARKKLGWVFIF
ncbi:SSI family serine proteinase inhibitor [Actinoplanes sp. ATCC 53533]|uniref:SSI family serine proteinase inhibitor n=1 Tax=Actinoplanes sp. ATCC 53533 TaxID=1288362 RepID=UPI001F348451|nr:SSI family serine proteinase inhibitor [Actinoplanes sp. ATCC 53533]